MPHNRTKPMLSGTVSPHNRQRVMDWHRQSGLSVSRIMDELIAFAVHNAYRPGSVSIAALRADARASAGETPRREATR